MVEAPKPHGDGPYYLGNRFTIADLAIAPFVSRLFLLGAYNDSLAITREDSPEGNLNRFFEWKEALEKRPSVRDSTPAREVLIEGYRKFVK